MENSPCTLSQYCRTYGLDLPTSSVITGMRGTKAGVIPPRRSPPCTIYLYDIVKYASQWLRSPVSEEALGPKGATNPDRGTTQSTTTTKSITLSAFLYFWLSSLVLLINVIGHIYRQQGTYLLVLGKRKYVVCMVLKHPSMFLIKWGGVRSHRLTRGEQHQEHLESGNVLCTPPPARGG